MATLFPFAGRLLARASSGEAEIEGADAWMQAIARLSDDVAEAVPVVAGPGEAKAVAFGAEAARFWLVRPALGKASVGGLEIVTYTIEASEGGSRLMRGAQPFAADLPEGGRTAANGIELIQGSFGLRFDVISRAGHRSGDWHDPADLPARVELSTTARGRGFVPPSPIVLPTTARIAAAAP